MVIAAAAVTPCSAIGQSTETLIKNLSSPRVEVRADAAEALAHRKDKTATKALVKALNSETVESIRGQIFAALGNTRDPNSVPGLLLAVKSSKPSVRAGAVRALGVIGDKRAVKAVIGALKDRDAGVRRAAAVS